MNVTALRLDTAPPPGPPPGRGTRRPYRVIAASCAALLLLAACGFLVAAGAQATSGGSFATPDHRFTTPTSALKTDEIDVGESSARAADPNPDLGELARVRIVIRPSDPAVPLFVGIGPKERVEAYLRDTAHDDFVSADLKPFRADFRRMPGHSRPADPTAQNFWAASSSGTGTRTLSWDKTHGAWSVVVMRLDGEPGVDVHGSIGLRFGFLLPVGVLLALLAAATLVLIRTRQFPVTA